MTGKEKCRILRSIRKEIAEQNGIEIKFDECSFEGECRGTCPKCDSEMRQLEAELNKKASNGSQIYIRKNQFSSIQVSCGNNDYENKKGAWLGDMPSYIRNWTDDPEPEEKISVKVSEDNSIITERKPSGIIERIKNFVDEINSDNWDGGITEFEPEEKRGINPIEKIKSFINDHKKDDVDDREESQKAIYVGMDYGTRIHHSEKEIETVRNGPLEMLGLSEMAYGCMKIAGKTTVKDILEMTKEELAELEVKNNSCYLDVEYKVHFWELKFDYENKK